MHPGDLAKFCAALPHLQVLSSLKFIGTGNCAAGVLPLAAAVARCTALEQLSLANDVTSELVPGLFLRDCFSGFSALERLTQLTLQNTWAHCRCRSNSEHCTTCACLLSLIVGDVGPVQCLQRHGIKLGAAAYSTPAGLRHTPPSHAAPQHRVQIEKF